MNKEGEVLITLRSELADALVELHRLRRESDEAYVKVKKLELKIEKAELEYWASLRKGVS